MGRCTIRSDGMSDRDSICDEGRGCRVRAGNKFVLALSEVIIIRFFVSTYCISMFL